LWHRSALCTTAPQGIAKPLGEISLAVITTVTVIICPLLLTQLPSGLSLYGRIKALSTATVLSTTVTNTIILAIPNQVLHYDVKPHLDAAEGMLRFKQL